MVMFPYAIKNIEGSTIAVLSHVDTVTFCS